MAKYPDRRSAAIPALHAAQELHGWCSPEAIEQVAAVMQLTPAYLTSVATFYDMLETHPKPRNDVYVCTNISCSLRGADEFLEAMHEAALEDVDVNVRAFECLGACDIAPMASVNGEYVGPLEPADAARIVEDLRAGKPVLESKQLRYRKCADPGVAEGATRLQSAARRRAQGGHRRTRARGRHRRPARADGADRDPARGGRGVVALKILFDRIDEPGLNTLEVYRRRGGYDALEEALKMEPDEVLAQISDSGIRGRGGAGFRMGQKASFLPHGDMEKYLVCNADESEPGTFKDRELMQKSPHMLIEGIIIASYAVDIHRAFIYIRGEYAHQADILEVAIAEAVDAGLHRRADPGVRPLADTGPSPRRRRLHLRRGDRPARLARGQARQPAAEAPVPGDRGPVPRPDADQQRRDARDGPRDHPHERQGVRRDRHRDLDGHEARVGLGRRPAPRQLRDRAGDLRRGS